DYTISETSDRAIREILDVCRREGIGAALLVMPESTTVQGWYPPAVRAETDRYLGRLGAEYGVPLIDTRDWMNDTDFADGFHPWPEAAAVFTERFAREVLPAVAR